MMFILRNVLTLSLLSLSTFLARAQEVIAAGGDDFTAGELNLSWTLGEGVIETFEAGGLILTQGFHQPSLMITALTGVEGQVLVTAYPNPAVDAITIRLPTEGGNKLSAILFDASGRRLLTTRLTGGDQSLPLQDLSSGLYYLLVYHDQSVLKSFKIVKK